MAGYQGSSTRRIDTEALDALIDARLRDSRFAMKGTAGAYDPAKQSGAVQPKLTMTVGGRTLTAPTIPDVQHHMYGGGGYIFHLPIKPGNPSLLIALDRPQTAFRESGGDANAGQGRVNDLSNVVALPGGPPDSGAATGMTADGMFVGSTDGKRGMRSSDDGSVGLKGGPSGSDKLVVDAAGKVDLKSESGESLLQIIRDFLVAFRDHTNGGAPMAAPFITTANQLIAKIDGMKA